MIAPGIRKRSRPRVRIVLPAFNEERRLPPSVDRLVAFCRERLGGYRWKLLIAENGSTDRTASLAGRLAAALPEVSSLHLRRPGRGGALAASAALPGADYLVYMDVDLSTDLEALPRVLAELDSGADLAVGTRHTGGSRVVRRIGREVLSRSYNRLLRWTLQVRSFTDAQCGFKAFRLERVRPLVETVQDRGWFFDTELLVLAEREGLAISEIPVAWIENIDSRVRVPLTIAQALVGIVRMKFS